MENEDLKGRAGNKEIWGKIGREQTLILEQPRDDEKIER